MSHTEKLQQIAASDTIDAFDEDSELFDGGFSAPTTESTQIEQHAVVADNMIGWRFDQVAASVFSEFSRERLKSWLQDGQLTVNGQQVKPKARSVGGEQLLLKATLQRQGSSQPEDIPLDIIYEDDDILVINKPVGLVVHPGAGNWTGTLVNGLLFHAPKLAELQRAGLVHRIDKDTSGLLVIAKTLEAQFSLTKQLADKSVYRVYDALVVGHVIAGGTIDKPIRRHPVERTRMSVQPGGRPSVTHYKVLERFGTHTLVQAQLETGRTHQIRVHLSYVGFPLVGDSTYGGRIRLPKGASLHLTNTLKGFKRQALHARELGLIHPRTGEEMSFEAPWPDDFTALIEALRQEDDLLG